MEVGDYVRTKHGIEKITNIKEWVNFRGYEKIITTDKNQYETLYEQSEIIKSSPNIIDLIEVGDYVNGSYVEGFIEKNKFQNKLIITEAGMIDNNDIKSIVTKEQFEAMEYKIIK